MLAYMVKQANRAAYDDLVELAQLCAYQAKVTKSRDVAEEFRRMAKEYQRRAAQLDEGRLPNIGKP